MCPRFAFAVGVPCIGPAVTGAESTWVRLRLAPDCEPASIIPTPDGGDTDNQFLLNDIRLYVNGPVTD